VATRTKEKAEARRQREEREAEERKKERRKRRLWQVGSALVVAIAVVVIAILISSSSGGNDQKVTKNESIAATNLFTGVAKSGTTLGSREAKVTLYEFADLQCPFCRAYTLGPFPTLVNKYVKPGKVKMVWKNVTFLGGDSVTAARAAIAAGAQNRLWEFVDIFYKNQGTENSGYVTDKFIQDIATAAGADPAKLKSDMSAPFVEQELGAVQNQQTQFGINTTPTFLIQVGKGKPQRVEINGPDDLKGLQNALDKALKQSKGT